MITSYTIKTNLSIEKVKKDKKFVSLFVNQLCKLNVTLCNKILETLARVRIKRFYTDQN